MSKSTEIIPFHARGAQKWRIARAMQPLTNSYMNRMSKRKSCVEQVQAKFSGKNVSIQM